MTESSAPVDVLSGADFENQASTDLSTLVRNLVPSYNVNTQPISDAATIVRPANLRGLPPDHTLVLVNGKRRHRAAVIFWLGNGVSNGAQGPDISAIPSIALKQVEILRDGAAAQYGSDAIAGVMNFILKDANEGGSVEARYSETDQGDGKATTIAGNIGLPFTDNGFLNLSLEYGNTDATDRSVQRDDAIAVIAGGNTAVADPAQEWGSPKIDNDYKFWFNSGLDLGGSKEFYSWGNLVGKSVDGGFFFRNPNTRSAVFSDDDGLTLLIGDLLDAQDGVLDGSAGCPEVPITNNTPDPVALQQVFDDPNCFSFQEVFPGGFTPRFGGKVRDTSLLLGVKGELGNGLYWDVSASYGRNDVDFFIRRTVNASLGPATPTSFDPGDYTQQEVNVNADFSFAPTDNTNLAFGVEYREETFKVTVGQEESFFIGDLAPQGFSAASNGFPGFSNIAGGSFNRANVAAYVDGEWEPMDTVLINAAVRYEDFDSFGDTTNGKIGGNWRITDWVGLRATYGTGFKAPTPGQSNAFNVSTEFDATINELVNNGTIPSTSAVAMLRGGRALDPEDSTSWTAGVFFNAVGLDVTIDYFNIEVDDRLNLSQNFQLTQQEVDDLIMEGVTSAGNLQNFRFFTNDFNTETQGVDVVATYPVEWGSIGSTTFSLAYNQTNNVVSSFGETIDRARIRQIEEGLPETRANFSAHSFFGNWRILGRISYYDDYYDSEDGVVYSSRYLSDLEAAYTWKDMLTVTVGAQNLLDTTPQENQGAATGVGNKYGQYSPFGFNGRVWYGRLRYEFGG